MHVSRDGIDDVLARLPAGSPLVPDLQTALRSVIRIVQPLFRVSGSGLLLLDGAQALRDAAASDDGGRQLEAAQLEAEEGPCVDAVVYDVDTATVDVQADARWPVLARLLAGSRVHAVLGLPVHLGGAAVGSLNVYASERYEWDASDVEALRAVAPVIEHLLGAAVFAGHQEKLVGQLRQALDSRVPIERAVGLLMGRHGDDAVAAFNRLRRLARSQRRRVADVAADVLDSAGRPTPATAGGHEGPPPEGRSST